MTDGYAASTPPPPPASHAVHCELCTDHFPPVWPGAVAELLHMQNVALVCLMADGRGDREIARALGVGADAIRSRIARLMRDTGARSREHLVAMLYPFVTHVCGTNATTRCKNATACPAQAYCEALSGGS